MREFIRDFLIRRNNAKLVVAQIAMGEWVPRLNNISGNYYVAVRKSDERELWIGGGPFRCTVESDPCAFGLFWRHYVWWIGARRLYLEATNSAPKKSKVPIL